MSPHIIGEAPAVCVVVMQYHTYLSSLHCKHRCGAPRFDILTVINEPGYYAYMVEGGDDGVVGEINLYPGEEGGGDDITHTFWSGSQNRINISPLMTPLFSSLRWPGFVVDNNCY